MTIERNNMVVFLEKHKLGPVNNEEFTKDLEMIQLKQANYMPPQYLYENITVSDNIPIHHHHQIHEEIIYNPNEKYSNENFKNKFANLSNEKKEQKNMYSSQLEGFKKDYEKEKYIYKGELDKSSIITELEGKFVDLDKL